MDIKVTNLLPEALMLGLPEIDAQHTEIFFRIETLKEICFESRQLPGKLMDDLLAYLTEHFATEEQVAEGAGLYFSEHARKHRDALRRLDRAIGEVKAEKRDIHSLLRFVEFWFERHIIDDDKPFAMCFHRQRRVSSLTISPWQGRGVIRE